MIIICRSMKCDCTRESGNASRLKNYICISTLYRPLHVHCPITFRHYYSTPASSCVIVSKSCKFIAWLASVLDWLLFLSPRIFLLRVSFRFFSVYPNPFGVFFVLIPFPKSDLAESSESITRDWTVQPWPINSAKSEHSLFPIYTVYFFFSVLEGRDTKGRKNGIKCGDRDCVWESREYDLLRLLACSCFFA